MTKKKKTLGQKMIQANVLLANIMQEPFQSALKKYGYNEARWHEGHRLYQEANALIGKRNMAFTAQLKATRLLNKKKKEAGDYFTEKAIIARKALKKNQDLIKQLGLSGRKKESFAGWTTDARHFYNSAPIIPEVMIALEIFGITVDSLKKGLALIEDLEPLYADQKDKMGMAQVTILGRNKKTKALFSWISDVITCVRMAFKNDLQQLERLMITVYSKGYSPNRQAAGLVKQQQQQKVDRQETTQEQQKGDRQETTQEQQKGDRQETGSKEKIEPQRTQRKEFWSQISTRLPDPIAGHEKIAEGQNNLIEFFPEYWNKGDRIKRVIA